VRAQKPNGNSGPGKSKPPGNRRQRLFCFSRFQLYRSLAQALRPLKILIVFVFNFETSLNCEVKAMNSTKSKMIMAVSTFLLSLLIIGLWKSSEMKLARTMEQKSLAMKHAASGGTSENQATYEKVICTCEIGSEPASPVEIAEVKDFAGNVLGVAAHIYQPEEVHLVIDGAKPKWDYLAVSADSGSESIKLVHQPGKVSKGYDWTLVLKGKGVNLKQKVKNCAAVSDE
jgi:archaellum component FlaG (FlaF/FlaG flagellin family)